MAHFRGSDDTNALVTALSPLGVVKKACASTKKNGNDVNIHLIDQSGLQVLLGDIAPPPKVISLSCAAAFAW
jgi:hypothetical protein